MRYLLLLLLPFCLFAESWKLVWQDEFDGTEINKNNWSWDTAGNAWNWGNNEDQHYTSGRSENSRIEDGALIIEARKEEWQGKEYTSARLRTKGKAFWLYGKVEIRAKLPGGKGSWPALWMLPEDDFYGGWPNSGEIDIMEFVGFEPEKIYSTVHTEAYNHNIGTHKGSEISMKNITDSFHIYRVEWYPDSISFYVDSTHVFTFRPDEKNPAKWPFNKPFHLLMNVAVGGDWGGVQGIDNTIFPIQIVVDYVRAYKQVETPVTVEVLSHGEGTVSISPEKEHYTIGETVTLTASPADGKEFLQWNGTLTSTDNPLTYVVESHASFGAIFRTAGELLKNGDFADGMDNWSFHKSSGAATVKASDSGAVLQITESGDNAWDIQLEQKKLSLVKGKTYVVSTTISSSDSVVFTLGVGMSKEPWKNYLSKKVIVNKEQREITHEFTMSESDPEGRLYFDLGNSKGVFTVHSISLTEKSDSPILHKSSVGTQKHGALQLRGKTLSLGSHIPTGSALSIFDLKGRLLLQRSGVSASEQIHLPSSFAAGVYSVAIVSGGQVQQQKIVLQ